MLKSASIYFEEEYIENTQSAYRKEDALALRTEDADQNDLGTPNKTTA